MSYNGSEIHKVNAYRARLAASERQSCRFCAEKKTLGNIARHEAACVFNPVHLRFCPICNKPITKNHGKSVGKRGITCSHACANTHFRTGRDHPNWNKERYQNACQEAHEFKCVICQESRIVEVHHMDEDRTNNSPDNLIPLCPTHHQYWHSKHRHLVEGKIFEYLANWRKMNAGV